MPPKKAKATKQRGSKRERDTVEETPVQLVIHSEEVQAKLELVGNRSASEEELPFLIKAAEELLEVGEADVNPNSVRNICGTKVAARWFFASEVLLRLYTPLHACRVFPRSVKEFIQKIVTEMQEHKKSIVTVERDEDAGSSSGDKKDGGREGPSVMSQLGTIQCVLRFMVALSQFRHCISTFTTCAPDWKSTNERHIPFVLRSIAARFLEVAILKSSHDEAAQNPTEKNFCAVLKLWAYVYKNVHENTKVERIRETYCSRIQSLVQLLILTDPNQLQFPAELPCFFGVPTIGEGIAPSFRKQTLDLTKIAHLAVGYGYMIVAFMRSPKTKYLKVEHPKEFDRSVDLIMNRLDVHHEVITTRRASKETTAVGGDGKTLHPLFVMAKVFHTASQAAIDGNSSSKKSLDDLLKNSAVRTALQEYFIEYHHRDTGMLAVSAYEIVFLPFRSVEWNRRPDNFWQLVFIGENSIMNRCSGFGRGIQEYGALLTVLNRSEAYEPVPGHVVTAVSTKAKILAMNSDTLCPPVLDNVCCMSESLQQLQHQITTTITAIFKQGHYDSWNCWAYMGDLAWGCSDAGKETLHGLSTFPGLVDPVATVMEFTESEKKDPKKNLLGASFCYLHAIEILNLVFSSVLDSDDYTKVLRSWYDYVGGGQSTGPRDRKHRYLETTIHPVQALSVCLSQDPNAFRCWGAMTEWLRSKHVAVRLNEKGQELDHCIVGGYKVTREYAAFMAIRCILTSPPREGWDSIGEEALYKLHPMSFFLAELAPGEAVSLEEFKKRKLTDDELNDLPWYETLDSEKLKEFVDIETRDKLLKDESKSGGSVLYRHNKKGAQKPLEAMTWEKAIGIAIGLMDICEKRAMTPFFMSDTGKERKLKYITRCWDAIILQMQEKGIGELVDLEGGKFDANKRPWLFDDASMIEKQTLTLDEILTRGGEAGSAACHLSSLSSSLSTATTTSSSGSGDGVPPKALVAEKKAPFWWRSDVEACLKSPYLYIKVWPLLVQCLNNEPKSLVENIDSSEGAIVWAMVAVLVRRLKRIVPKGSFRPEVLPIQIHGVNYNKEHLFFEEMLMRLNTPTGSEAHSEVLKLLDKYLKSLNVKEGDEEESRKEEDAGVSFYAFNVEYTIKNGSVYRKAFPGDAQVAASPVVAGIPSFPAMTRTDSGAELNTGGGMFGSLAGTPAQSISPSSSVAASDGIHPLQRAGTSFIMGLQGLSCMICTMAPRNCFFYPCNHCACCTECFASLQEQGCPVCRKPITMVFPIYLY